jgi:hypothetical protein
VVENTGFANLSLYENGAIMDESRMTFIDETVKANEAIIDTLTRQIPELRGVALVFIWEPTIPAAGLPFGIVRGRHKNDPPFILRASEQAVKLQQTLTNEYLNQLVIGNQAMVDLNAEIDSKQTQLAAIDELLKEASSKNKSATADRRSADSAGSAGTSED